MSEYDIYLNGIGYMLAKDSKGALIPGAAREQIIDPFTSFLSRDEPYTRAPFRFGDGGGLSEYDGSNRYEWGNCIDTRSTRAILSADRLEIGAPEYQRRIDSTVSNIQAEELKTGTQEGIAERFQTPAGVTTIRAVSVLVKRSQNVSYASATTFSVGIFADASGTPGAAIQFQSVSIKKDADPWYFPDRWRNGDWFWLEVVLPADAVIGASTYFWIYVLNSQTPALYWAEDRAAGAGYSRSVYNGTAWSAGSNDYPMMVKVGYKDGTGKQYDSFIRCFQVYRGSDNVERMYAGTAYRILTWDPTYGAGTWFESKAIGYEVKQLLEFDNKLFAACGTGTDFWWSDGATGTSTDWTQITAHKASALAVHDHLLWKADGREVKGSADGLASSWGATAVEVGDNGTPVMSMVSHGGKLFAAKPEGIFEITYPDTYPTTGKPTANMLLDFSTERCPRPWMLDWHSGLYFPGLGGVYELKNNVLRNVWEDKVDENAIWAPVGSGGGWLGGAVGANYGIPGPYTRPRSWAPLYDKGPVSWTGAHATTRGMIFTRCNPHTETSDLIWWDGRNWFSLRAVGDPTSDGGPKYEAEYCTAAFVQDAGGGRGWMWFNEGVGISRTEWPTWTDDTFDDGTVEYENDGQLVTPWFSLPEQSKEILLCKAGLISQQLYYSGPDFIRVQLYYRTPGGSWNSVGTFDTSPYEELTFAANTKARRVQFQLRFETYGVTGTPVVEQLELFYQVLPEKTKTHQLIISCAGDHARRTGGVDERTAGEVLQDLRDLVGVASFTYTDLLGTDHIVRVSALTGQMMNELTGPGPEGVGVEAQAIVNLLEV